MPSYTEYAEQLEGYMSLAVGLLIVEVIAALVLTVVCIKGKYKPMAIGTAVGGVVLALAIYLVCILPYQLDINDNAYESYVGEFYVEDYYYTSRSGTYILLRCGDKEDSTRYKVLCDLDTLESGTTYTGSFTYSRRTKCLLALDCQDTP